MSYRPSVSFLTAIYATDVSYSCICPLSRLRLGLVSPHGVLAISRTPVGGAAAGPQHTSRCHLQLSDARTDRLSVRSR